MFTERRTKRSDNTKRPLTEGVGVNDAEYAISATIDGVEVNCPYYKTWRNMLKRCYNSKYKEKYPTYKGCKVCDEWLIFSNFKKWMEKQDWKGKQLDKDIMNKGNKVYSDANCIFVTEAINNLILNNNSSRGKYKTGVSYIRSSGKYRAKCNIKGKSEHIGCFDAEEDAYIAYKKRKNEFILEVASTCQEPLRTALSKHLIE